MATWPQSIKVPDPIRHILGIAFVLPIRGTADVELQFLWVDLKYRGMNIGSQLISKAAALAKDDKAKRIVIKVPRDAEEFVLKYFRDTGSSGTGTKMRGRNTNGWPAR